MGEERQAGTAPVIETASATTSADNARSGGLAYVIAVATVVLLALLGSGLSGCMSLASDLVLDAYGPSGSYGLPYEYDFLEEYLDDRLDFDDYDDLEVWLDRHEEAPRADGDADAEAGTLAVEEALDGSLAMYDATIDSLLPAMSYANANGEVRDFVRQVVLADRNASSDLHATLREAAWGSRPADEALSSALELAEATAQDLRDTDLPRGTGEVSRALETGRSAAIARWDAVVCELELLAGSDGEVDARDMDEADGAVADAAEEAAEAFAEALSASVAR